MVTKSSKYYVLDTNVLIHDPNAIDALGDNYVVVPIPVLEELDKLKKGNSMTAVAARTASRKIDEYRIAGKERQETLRGGVTTANGGRLIVDSTQVNWEDFPLLERKNDNKIMLCALAWNKDKKAKNKVILISKDTNVRTLGDGFGLEVDDYEHDKTIGRIDELYTGVVEFNITDLEANTFLHELPQKRTCSILKLENVDIAKIFSNQCCVIRYKHKEVWAIYKGDGVFNLVDKVKPPNGSKKIMPINRGQAFAMRMLMDQTISLVTLAGKAGTGKTLLALAAALDQVGESNNYRKILVWRPMETLGKDIGFLPGSLDEKFAVWTGPIYDNLDLMIGEGNGEFMGMANLLDVKPFYNEQGASKHGMLIIVDEAQNIEPMVIKQLIERAGAGTKVVLTGDPYQVMHKYLDAVSNGLTHVVERVKESSMSGHILLTKGERSPLAEMAADLL